MRKVPQPTHSKKKINLKACPLAQLDIVKYQQPLIAHVHESNPEPRGILSKLGFEFVERITLRGADASDAPVFLRNDAGEVVGDVLRLTRQGIRDLARWLNEEFDGTVVRSGARVRVNFGIFPIESLAEARKGIAENLPE